MKLISASPSLYLRKVKISLIEKNIDSKEIIDIPWTRATITNCKNFFGKVPILLLVKKIIYLIVKLYLII